MKLFNLRKIEDRGEVGWKNDWMAFHPEFRKANFNVEKAGYFDSRPQMNFTITTGLGLLGLLLSPLVGLWFAVSMIVVILFIPWGQVYLHLPYDTGINTAETPRWGFSFYGEGTKIPDSLIILKGKKSKIINLPWALDWVRTSRMLKDGLWSHERKEDRKRGVEINWWSDEFQAKLWKETHDYTYVLKNGTVQERKATITVEQREWRPRWFRWTSLFNKIRTDIDIEFDQEVGERTGSYKGGTVGCSYELLPGETPVECLYRMQRERTFN